MQLLSVDERFLQRAVELATDAAAFASPNPTVGCVIARDGLTIGEGAHRYDDFDHAEITALKQVRAAEQSPVGATAYVTLEPCAHRGRTGPCAVALVSEGIARCVIATVDPNPLVSGKGIQILRDGGVLVELADTGSAVASAARRLNEAFAFSIQRGRPFVTLKAAVSLDGYLAPPPSTRGESKPVWLTGEAARGDVQQLRHQSDAILTGVGTVLADNPSLTDRTGLPRRRRLLRVILDSKLRTSPQANVLRDVQGDVLIFTTAAASSSAAEELERTGAEVLRVPDLSKEADLSFVLHTLHQRGVGSVLIEAGSAVNAAFLAADVVDRVVLYYSDIELGQASVPFAGKVMSPYSLQGILKRVARLSFPHDPQSEREDVRICGYLHDPWELLP